MESSLNALMSKPKPEPKWEHPEAVWLALRPCGKGGWGVGDTLQIVSAGAEGAMEYQLKLKG